MSITYEQLTNSEVKLAILLFGLSFPTQTSPEYWQKWFKQPIHEYVFQVIRGLSKHRQRIIRLRNEEDYLRNQFTRLHEQLLTPEDLEQVKGFLQKEYKNLIRAEKAELAEQIKFLEEKLEKVANEIVEFDKQEARSWQQLFDEQLKVLKKELKKRGMNEELKKLENDLPHN